MGQSSGERELWAAVVLQARDDVQQEPFDSVAYTAAAAFFASPGDWASSRQAIADCLALHVDDLTRMGRRALNLRRAEHGLAPLALVDPPGAATPLAKGPIPRKPPPRRQPFVPQILPPTPKPPAEPPAAAPGPKPRKGRLKLTIDEIRARSAVVSARRAAANNPFNPFRRRA